MFDLDVLMDTPATRLEQLMEENRLETQADLASKLNIDVSSVSKHIKTLRDTSRRPSAIFLENIENTLGWSATWIRTGQGPKRLNSHSVGKPKTIEAVPMRLVDETEVVVTGVGNEFRRLDNGMVLMTIPLVDEYAYASYPHGWKDPEYIDELPKHSIVLSSRDTGRYLAFTVRGDSMRDGTERSISEGDIATGLFIEPDAVNLRSNIKVGHDYIIVNAEGIVVKKIAGYDAVNFTITCTSSNPDKLAYPDYEVNLKEVYQIFKVFRVDKKW